MEDTSTLSVLESLSSSPDLNQRKIAIQTGLNLAKVNFVLKKLVEKGFVKLQRVKDNPHKRRYLYLLTPAGISEKSRLTYRFLQRTLRHYEEAEGKVRDCVESMLAQGVHRLVLWGKSEITDLCERVLKSMNGKIRVVGVVDPFARDPAFIHPSMLASLSPDAILICQPDSPAPPSSIQSWRLS